LPRGPSGPYAEFGKLVHTLTDLAITGRLGRNGVPADVTVAFEYLLAETAARLSLVEETRRYADLTVAFTKREWEKRRFFAISDAEKVKRQGSGSSRRAPPQTARDGEHRRVIS
jgi:hypothetical protein